MQVRTVIIFSCFHENKRPAAHICSDTSYRPSLSSQSKTDCDSGLLPDYNGNILLFLRRWADGRG
ncbi:hypothetical protein INR49_002897 [Caranx melampygus]|nr:hypothetical protein INR49_002897 [Caranx melampygus]